MGELFLELEEAADELDAMQPELGKRFRIANGLPLKDDPAEARDGSPTGTKAGPGGTDGHDIRMVVDDEAVRGACACGRFTAEVGLDEIDTMVLAIREHLGSAPATSDHMISVEDASQRTERKAG